MLVLFVCSAFKLIIAISKFVARLLIVVYVVICGRFLSKLVLKIVTH